MLNVKLYISQQVLNCCLRAHSFFIILDLIVVLKIFSENNLWDNWKGHLSSDEVKIKEILLFHPFIFNDFALLHNQRNVSRYLTYFHASIEGCTSSLILFWGWEVRKPSSTCSMVVIGILPKSVNFGRYRLDDFLNQVWIVHENVNFASYLGNNHFTLGILNDSVFKEIS